MEELRSIGAAWARVLPDLAPHPELAIAVRPQAQRAGVGTRLLDGLADAARAAGHRALALRVSPRNPALCLYRRCGFEGAGVDGGRLVLRRSLLELG